MKKYCKDCKHYDADMWSEPCVNCFKDNKWEHKWWIIRILLKLIWH